jgi:drug/metabolite transporter (DMT)-like permease
MDGQDVKDVLWKLCQDHYTHVRHYETQRSTVTNLLLTIAAALLAFITYDKVLSRSDIPLTVLLFIVGLFGAAFSVKYHERSSFHYNRLLSHRNELDKLLSSPGILARLREEAEAKHSREFPMLYKGPMRWWKVHRLWIFLHLLVACFGLLLTVLAVYSVQAPPPKDTLRHSSYTLTWSEDAP